MSQRDRKKLEFGIYKHLNNLKRNVISFPERFDLNNPFNLVRRHLDGIVGCCETNLWMTTIQLGCISKENMNPPRKESKSPMVQPGSSLINESPILSSTMGRVAGDEALRYSKDFEKNSNLAKRSKRRNVTKLRWSDLEIGKLLGEGNFSHVYEVRLIYRDDLPETDTIATGSDTIQDDVWKKTSMNWKNPTVESDADIWDLVSVANYSGSDSNEEESEPEELRKCKVKERVYALKHLHPNVTKKQKVFTASAIDLVIEAKILSCLDHPNIVKLYGVTEGSVNKIFTDHGYFLLLDRLTTTLEDKILEWKAIEAICSLKSVSPPSSLRRHSVKQKSFRRRNDNTGEEDNPSSTHQKDQEKALMHRIGAVAIDIAKGMEYLHANRVIFRDLKV
jgi:Protein tyrosine and serine/threonine kinase